MPTHTDQSPAVAGKKVYLSGPMTGLPYYNYPAFTEAAYQLRAMGADVFNPAEHGALDTSGCPTGTEPVDGFDLRASFAEYARYITTEAELVVALPGWRDSKGACAEVALANVVGLPVIDYETYALTRAQSPDLKGVDVLVDPVDLRACMDRHPAGKGRPETVNVTPITGVRPGETGRAVSASGAQKGTKECRIDLIPPTLLYALGVVFGRGGIKYKEHNWTSGYATSLSYSAALRHLNQWNFGEDIDADQGVPHLAAAAFHLAVLLHTTKVHPECDDRADWGPHALESYVDPCPQWLLDLAAAKDAGNVGPTEVAAE